MGFLLLCMQHMYDMHDMDNVGDLLFFMVLASCGFEKFGEFSL